MQIFYILNNFPSEIESKTNSAIKMWTQTSIFLLQRFFLKAWWESGYYTIQEVTERAVSEE